MYVNSMVVESLRENFLDQIFTSLMSSHTFGSYEKEPFFLDKMQQTWVAVFMDRPLLINQYWFDKTTLLS